MTDNDAAAPTSRRPHIIRLAVFVCFLDIETDPRGSVNGLCVPVDDAREIVARLRTITPVVVPPLVPFRNPEHRELYLSGLRLAAGEATVKHLGGDAQWGEDTQWRRRARRAPRPVARAR